MVKEIHKKTLKIMPRNLNEIYVYKFGFRTGELGKMSAYSILDEFL
jgi:hypothetical protein